MNKNLIKSALITLMLMSSSAFAEWENLGNDGENDIFIKSDSIKFLDAGKTKRQVWLKIEATQNNELMKKGEFTQSLNAFDCKNGKFKIDSLVVYGPNKKVIAQNDESSGWLAIPPDSQYDELSSIVCSY